MSGRRVPRFGLALLALAGLAHAGCSTLAPLDTGRRGLIDRLAEENSRHPRRGRAPQAQGEPVDRGAVATVRLTEARLREIRRDAERWAWPVRDVRVTSHFGERGRSFHEGIDLKAPPGTPIHAVQRGQVVYAARRIRGYGLMVIVQHPSGLSTVYAHNSRLLVRKGDRVRRGQRIAFSGATGRARGPHLHFEIRDGVAAVNPYRVLPPRPGAGTPDRRRAGPIEVQDLPPTQVAGRAENTALQ